MLKAHSALRIIDGFATFVKTVLIIASTQVSIFTFALYRKFSAIDANSLSFQQWQSIVIQTWESTTVNKVQMYLIVLIYLVIAIPLTIKASRYNKQTTSITQRISECYQTEYADKQNNEVESRVNYPPVATDDEAQDGINSDTEKDVKN